MTVSLDEMKKYLRVDFDDDDTVIEELLKSAEILCADIARLAVNEFSQKPAAKIAVMYVVAYLYEHRENVDYKELTLSLRSLLFGIRKEGF